MIKQLYSFGILASTRTDITYNVDVVSPVNNFSVEVNRPSVVAVRKLNEKIAGDDRVKSVMMNIGDGYTLVTKQ